MPSTVQPHLSHAGPPFRDQEFPHHVVAIYYPVAIISIVKNGYMYSELPLLATNDDATDTSRWGFVMRATVT